MSIKTFLNSSIIYLPKNKFDVQTPLFLSCYCSLSLAYCCFLFLSLRFLSLCIDTLIGVSLCIPIGASHQPKGTTYIPLWGMTSIFLSVPGKVYKIISTQNAFQGQSFLFILFLYFLLNLFSTLFDNHVVFLCVTRLLAFVCVFVYIHICIHMCICLFYHFIWVIKLFTLIFLHIHISTNL